MKITRAALLVQTGGLVLGGALGWLYWHEIGCHNGACMIWSNPWIATGYGALLGFFLSGMIPLPRKSVNDSTDEAPPSDPARDVS